MFGGGAHPPNSIERLIKEVRSMDVEGVEKCIEAGVRVNDPINPTGQTVLDLYVIEHAAMIEHALQVTGTPKEATLHFEHLEEAAFKVMKTLVDAGAVLSGSSSMMKRGFKQDGT
mmetsp:Transcript_62894/g.137793  ORF Transcript_62894/g.137793 Transcript_62894/m.137793 type:complete len:115 (+) Transcript_62894:71-415(+)